MILSVTDVQDPRIAPFRFVRERDLVGRDGAFMAEGEVVLRQLLRQLGHGETDARPGLGHRLSALLLSEVQARRLADLITGLPDEVPVYVASQAIMDKVTGFPIHRGILALGVACPMPEAAALLDSLPARALVVGAVGLTNHDNMGGIFRNAAAFGAGAVLLDGASCDPLYRKAIRVSVGASLSVPFARVPNTLDMVDLLESRGFQVIALSPAGREPHPPAQGRSAVRDRGTGPAGRRAGPGAYGVHSHGGRFRQPERGHHLRHRPAPSGAGLSRRLRPQSWVVLSQFTWETPGWRDRLFTTWSSSSGWTAVLTSFATSSTIPSWVDAVTALTG